MTQRRTRRRGLIGLARDVQHPLEGLEDRHEALAARQLLQRVELRLDADHIGLGHREHRVHDIRREPRSHRRRLQARQHELRELRS